MVGESVPVEFAWINERCPVLLASVGGDYDKAVLQKSANPIDISLPEPQRSYYSLWESYVAALDPMDSNATFRATIATTNGVPCVKGDPESLNRKYTILGKQTLTDEVWSANCHPRHPRHQRRMRCNFHIAGGIFGIIHNTRSAMLYTCAWFVKPGGKRRTG